MKVSILINNYNYQEYIGKAIESALYQSYENIEIIVIDDGSTDNSKNIIDQYASKESNVKAIYKENGGQLSTFNIVKEHISGDIVFFLDADDIYKVDYVYDVVEIYNKNDVDFVFCAFERFYEDGKVESINKFDKDYDLGFSFLSTLYTKEWLGSETSTISMKREIYNKITPIPYEEDWITRADDCLIWASSMVGARKYYFNKSSVLYRVHNNNSFFKKEFSSSCEFKRAINVNKFFNYFLNIHKYNNILNILFLEFELREPKNLINLKLYFRIVEQMDTSFLFKIKYKLVLLKKYFKSKI